MSKLLVRSRSLLPMVIKKSQLETSPTLETHPTVASKLDVPSKKESPETKIIMEKECRKEEIIKTLLQTNIPYSKDFPINKVQRRTLVQAVMEDVMQMQCWLTKLLAKGHTWMFRREPELVMQQTDGSGVLYLGGCSRPKEEEPNSILPEHSKTKPMKQTLSENYSVKKVDATKKSDTKSLPMKSSIVETLLERGPEWQKSISGNLGSIWKKVVEKLPKQ